MKKLLAGLFIFGALTVGLKADALTFSEALLKIQSLTQELTQLRSSLKGSIGDVNLPTISNVTTDPSWASLGLHFNVSSPVTVTEAGYCLKKTSNVNPCARNIIRGISSYSDVNLSIASIEPSTNYTLYVYAKNSYGEDKSSDINFTSLAVPIEAYDFTVPTYLSPRVEIYPAPPGLTSSTASVGGHLTSLGTEGILERGACYGSSASSISSCMTAYLVQGPNDMFATKFIGLTPSTTYYYKVYAKNNRETVYSVVGNFTTIAGAADLTPINGGWTSWTNSGSCVNSLQTQTRTCTNPLPLNGGTTCSGVSTQQISCSSAVNGGWSAWTSSGGCVNNLQTIIRTCTNPAPSNGGTTCTGVSTEQGTCNSSLPNLVASRVDNIPLSTTPTFAFGSSVTFTGTITNSGIVPTSGIFYSHFELKSSLNSATSIINLPSASSGAIAANGGTARVSSGLNLTTAANYSIRLCADQSSSTNNSGLIAESSEIDNCSDWSNFVVGSTVVSPVISVLSPNGGESYTAGQQITVKWNSSNTFEKKVSLGLVTSTGAVYPIINDVYDSGSYVWTIPLKISISGDSGVTDIALGQNGFKIAISDDGSPRAYDISNNTFTINTSSEPVATSITVLSPNGGESYKQYDEMILKWSSSGINLSDLVNVYLVNTSTNVEIPLITNTPNDGVQGTVLANSLEGTFKVKVVSTGVNKVSDISNGTFSINKSAVVTGCESGTVYSITTGQRCPEPVVASVTVTSPNGGESVEIGKYLTINYNIKSAPANSWVGLSLYKDGVGLGYITLGADTYLPNGLAWKVGDYVDYIGGPTHVASVGTGYTVEAMLYKGELPIGKVPSYPNQIGITFDKSNAPFTIMSSNSGCSNGEIYSSTTGQKCVVAVVCPAEVPSVLCPPYETEPIKDARGCIVEFRCKVSTGCSNGEIYSSATGQKCSTSTSTVDIGCQSGQRYSTTTGMLCPVTSTTGGDTSTVTTTGTANTTPITRTLRRGVSGDDVKRLQEFLQIYSDGVFGRGTAAKVKEWQLKNGLTADGLFGRGSRIKAGLE